MKKIFSLLFLSFLIFGYGQLENIKPGEILHYRIHYGVLNAGTATLSAQRTTYAGTPHLYVKGVGQSTGAVRAFFRVNDRYESYINLSTGLPSFYVRNVKEGGYSQHLEAKFNQRTHSLVLTDKKTPSNPPRTIQTVRGLQDMLSAFYYLRGLDSLQLKPGRTIKMNVWIDDNLFPFRLRVDKYETLKTKFGSISAIRITPMVISGRVFKAREGVTMWVSNDRNHVPLLLQAQLTVGSLKASIENYSNVKYPLNFK